MVTIQDPVFQFDVYLNAIKKCVCPNASNIKIHVLNRFNTGRTINKSLYRFLPLLFLVFVTLSEKKQ